MYQIYDISYLPWVSYKIIMVLKSNPIPKLHLNQHYGSFYTDIDPERNQNKTEFMTLSPLI